MVLSDEVKQQISEEFEAFKADMYAKSTLEDRKTLGQFFTPARVSIQMLERFDYETISNKVILDPCCGSGNLLAAALIAGADSDKIFGNEYDLQMIEHCRNRLNKVCDMLGKPHINYWQIHRGNALQKKCLTEFGPEYYEHYNAEYIDDLEYAQGKHSWKEDNELAKQRASMPVQLSIWDLPEFKEFK